MSIDWKVRPYRSEDEQQALRLFRETFNKPRTIEVHRWKYFESPSLNDLPSVFVATTGDRIVGQFCGVAQPFKLGDEELTIMHGCDVLTASEFRRHGILASVGRATFDGWKDAGVAFCVGLENKQWGSRVKLLDLRPCLQTSSLSLPLRLDRRIARRLNVPGRIGRPLGSGLEWFRRRRWPVTGDIHVRFLDVPEPCLDNLWQARKDDMVAAVRRDRTWLTYRYFSAPQARYRMLLAERSSEPVGYMCYRVSQQADYVTGIVADWLADWDDIEAMNALIAAMIGNLENEGAESISLPVVAHPPTIHAFERFGFRRRNSYSIVAIPLARSEPDPAMRDPLQWFVMPGDFDIV